MSEVLPNLYLGGLAEILPLALDIKICVLNAGETAPPNTIHIPIITLEGNQIVALKNNLDEVANVIDKALNEGKKVGVFCIGGVDRSPFSVVYYLVVKKGMNWNVAYDFVKSKRPQIAQHLEWVGTLNH
jgi:protein-tyrosine phosphatase